jgi:hypothetical protein
MFQMKVVEENETRFMSIALFPEVMLFRENWMEGMLSVISEFVYWTVNAPSFVIVEVTLRTRIREVRDSNLGRDEVQTEGFRGFSRS